eukprot:s1013_g10.t1
MAGEGSNQLKMHRERQNSAQNDTKEDEGLFSVRFDAVHMRLRNAAISAQFGLLWIWAVEAAAPNNKNLWDGSDPDTLQRDHRLEQVLDLTLRRSPNWARGHALKAALCNFWQPRNRSCATTGSRQALRWDQKDEVALLTAASIEAERMPRDTSLKTLPSSSTSYQSMIWRTFNNTLARKQRRKRPGAKRFLVAMSLKPSRAMVNKAIMQMTFLARHDLADAFKQFSVKEGLWRSTTQRPLTYWSSLDKETPFPGAEVDERLPLTAEQFQLRLEEFKDEILQQRLKLGHNAGFTPCAPNTWCWEEDSGILPENSRFRGFWETGIVFMGKEPQPGEEDQRCSKLLPRTCRVIQEIWGISTVERRPWPQEILGGSGLTITGATISSVFGPYTSIAPHAAKTQGRFRLHCVLQLPSDGISLLRVHVHGRERYHRRGECFWFDESSDHDAEFISKGTEPRVLLMVDIEHPQLQGKGQPEPVSAMPFSARYWNSFLPSDQPLYAPSPLEAEWLRHAEKWMETDEAPLLLCERLPSRTVAKWLEAFLNGQVSSQRPEEALETSDLALDPSIFSAFWHLRDASLHWIEPLVATLSHPATHCHNLWPEVQNVTERHFESSGYLLLSRNDWLADPGQRILFDAGVSTYKNSTSWLFESYSRNGIVFDRIFGWEMKLEGHEQIPSNVLQQSSFSTDRVVSTRDDPSHSNPVQLISQLCRPEDFCVFKSCLPRTPGRVLLERPGRVASLWSLRQRILAAELSSLPTTAKPWSSCSLMALRYPNSKNAQKK